MGRFVFSPVNSPFSTTRSLASNQASPVGYPWTYTLGSFTYTTAIGHLSTVAVGTGSLSGSDTTIAGADTIPDQVSNSNSFGTWIGRRITLCGGMLPRNLGVGTAIGLNVDDVVCGATSNYSVKTGKGVVSLGDTLLLNGGYGLGGIVLTSSQNYATQAGDCLIYYVNTGGGLLTLTIDNTLYPLGYVLKAYDYYGSQNLLGRVAASFVQGGITVLGTHDSVTNANSHGLQLTKVDTNTWIGESIGFASSGI